jgi:hypothetical protein
MSSKWVDNEVYFGPDRRKGAESKRWKNRRTMNDAADPPPVGALLRRLRVIIPDKSPSARRRAQQLARLAVTEAEKLRWLGCADQIKAAASLIAKGDVPAADACIVSAISLVGQSRFNR